MEISYLKNPFVIGIVVGVCAYLYLYWDNTKDKKKGKKSISLLTPVVLALISWFIASYCFNSSAQVEQSGQQVTQPVVQQTNLNLVDNTIQKGGAASSDSFSYHLIGKNNIKLPKTDVFIDIAKF